MLRPTPHPAASVQRTTALRLFAALALCIATVAGSAFTTAASTGTPGGPAYDMTGSFQVDAGNALASPGLVVRWGATGTLSTFPVRWSSTIDGDGYTQVVGTKAGAYVVALRPDDWNGSLVVLMHGQVDPSEPVQLPPPNHEPLWSDLIDHLVADGYGVAFSSYRTNGFAVREGVLDTRIATAMFTSRFGKPDRSFLVGISMGAHIGQKLLETAPNRYDGFLSVCGGLGGSSLQWEYFINARILFDYYFPGVLPGNAWSKTDLDFEHVVIPAVVGAITSNEESFLKAIELAGIDQLAIPWTSPEELVIGIVSSLVSAGGGTGDFQKKTGGIAVDNTETYYSGSADDTALNAGVKRFKADPNAVRFLTRFDPDGTLAGTPVLALHTTMDPIVLHQTHVPAYEAVLAAQGNQHLFATRLIDRFGHCAFLASEVFDAFQDLTIWSETGNAP